MYSAQLQRVMREPVVEAIFTNIQEKFSKEMKYFLS